MTASSSIVYLILSACQFIVLLRFICQAMRVNYYNPVTQSIVRISGYLVKPFELLGNNLNNYLLFLVLYTFTFLKLYLPLLVSSQNYPLDSLFIISFGYLVRDLLHIYWY